MQVSELADRTGVPAHVVRYYTQIGLLTPKRNPTNGYRVYAETDVYRVRFVRRAALLGFSLRDIRLILADADAGTSPCPSVRRIIRIRLEEAEKRLKLQHELVKRMLDATSTWANMPDSQPDHDSLCHLIDTVAADRALDLSATYKL